MKLNNNRKNMNNTNNTFETQTSDNINILNDRYTLFDKEMNNLNYDIIVKKFIYDFNEFKNRYLKKMLIIACGGHKYLSEFCDSETLFEILDKELENNEMLRNINYFYNEMEKFAEDLRCFDKAETDYLNKIIDELGEKFPD